MAYLNLLLPFPKDSFLTGGAQGDAGGHYALDESIARSIQKWTRGKLRDVMILVVEASKLAIDENLPCLDGTVLEKTWKHIQTNPLEAR